MPNLPEKKESPIMGAAGVGGGVGSNLVAGAPKEKVYVDDVYATYTYRGLGNNDRDIINDLDLAGKGGMVIQKQRDYASYWPVTDTVRGANNMLRLNGNNANNSAGQAVSQFNSNGFNIGDSSVQWNSSSYDYASWSFCKQKGFFDIVTYQGTGTQTAVPHDLGCVPSMVWVKRLSGSEYFCVWSKEFNEMGYNQDQAYLQFKNETVNDMANRFGAPPTATHFTVGYDNQTNSDGGYVAYLFGGGAATGYNTTTNPLANSCNFNGGANGALTTANSTDFTANQGDFTLECWFKAENFNNQYGILLDLRGGGGGPAIYHNNQNIVLDKGGSAVCQSTNEPLNRNQWYHVAGTRVGDNWYLYLNGKEVASAADSVSYSASTDFKIGRSNNSGERFSGWISNVRWTNGQALYTGGFQPSWEPLTTTSQGATASKVKFLCCQNSTATGTTVAPAGITLSNAGGVSLTELTPFIDKESLIFGDDQDQPIIRSGSYTGNGGDNQVDCGFQPAFVLIKRLDSGDDWILWDQHRNFGTWVRNNGTGSGRLRDGASLTPNRDYVENGRSGGNTSSGVRIASTPTGFLFISESNGIANGTSNKYMWVAVRDIDGQVSKPAESGIDVFAMATGSGSSQGPNFASRQGSGTSTTGFIRGDYVMATYYSQSWGKRVMARPCNKYNSSQFWVPGESNTGNDGSNDDLISGVFDFEDGSNRGGWNSSSMAWMWRKSAGFTTLSYQGTGSGGHTIAHDLGGTPEMMWFCNRVTNDWKGVYHFGANNGVTPWLWGAKMNNTAAFDQGNYYWDNTAPDEYSFTLGNNQAINWANEHFNVALFRSVTGISKCGWYTGTTANQNIDCGFTPRFLLVKASNSGSSDDGWNYVDTVRGWGAGDDKVLFMQKNDGQVNTDVGAPYSTGVGGFTLTGNLVGWNQNSINYVYYAHA
tara:strand:+ start:439 stop:3231 length:2793 start_codon:yes stop_codon:yes gene_type:complete